ncbi:MAG TPA: ABC transporter ATP-binding protein [Acidimicrobiia bacterium]|nr:ABC transporter ATP-binding protein [Acidimicrobiia bacterium]
MPNRVTNAVVVEGLRKTYKSTVALDGLSFTIPAGKVTGFLGPNGAGKTTTFRSLLGLTSPDSGTMQVLGMNVKTELAQIVPRLGAIVEEPGLIKGLNGRDNLRVAAHTLGHGHEKIDELLAFAGLAADAGRRIDGYSKGMRQRLALAAALLGDPELLFLDEPLDGLDPAGQAQIKASLRQLAADGRTIVVSSHNLGDVEAMADEVVVINRGRLVTQSSLDEILGVQTAAYHVEIDDPVRAVQILVAAGIPASTTDGLVLAKADNGSDVSRILAGAGFYPSALYKQSGRRLEEVFLRLTGGQE